MAEGRNSSEIYWVDPPQRGIFPIEHFHISKSLRRRLNKRDVIVTTNRNFEAVVKACANRKETWINEEIFALYLALHQNGYAHSIEVTDQENCLIGGVYGVTLGSAFFGESMFSTKTNGSKIALAYLISHLKQRGFTLFDTQFITDHLESLGAIEIDRAEYHELLEEALTKRAIFPSDEPLVWSS